MEQCSSALRNGIEKQLYYTVRTRLDVPPTSLSLADGGHRMEGNLLRRMCRLLAHRAGSSRTLVGTSQLGQQLTRQGY
jgi:hypothetical protein